MVKWNQATFVEAKFIIGMILAVVIMVIAGTIEKFRQNECHPGM